MKKRLITVIAASTMLITAPVYATDFDASVAFDVSLKQGEETEAYTGDLAASVQIDTANQTFHIVTSGSAMDTPLNVDVYGKIDGVNATLYGSLDGENWVTTTQDASEVAGLFSLDLSTPIDLSGLLDGTVENGYNVYAMDLTLSDIYSLVQSLGIPMVDEQLESMGITADTAEQILPLLDGVVLSLNLQTAEADSTFASFHADLNSSDFSTINALMGGSMEIGLQVAQIDIAKTADDTTVEIPAEIVDSAVEGDLNLGTIG